MTPMAAHHSKRNALNFCGRFLRATKRVCAIVCGLSLLAWIFSVTCSLGWNYCTVTPIENCHYATTAFSTNVRWGTIETHYCRDYYENKHRAEFSAAVFLSDCEAFEFAISPFWNERLSLWPHLLGAQFPDTNENMGIHSVITPLWLPFAICAAPAAILFHRDRRLNRIGHCRKCNYNLTGNTGGICSECGTPITLLRCTMRRVTRHPLPAIQKCASERRWRI